MHEGTRETWEQKIKKLACYICPILAEKLKLFGEGCGQGKGSGCESAAGSLHRRNFDIN